MNGEISSSMEFIFHRCVLYEYREVVDCIGNYHCFYYYLSAHLGQLTEHILREDRTNFVAEDRENHDSSL